MCYGWTMTALIDPPYLHRLRPGSSRGPWQYGGYEGMKSSKV
jgi:hypothetical protein